MTIRTDRLLLRPLCLSDLKTVHEYACDSENTKYMLFLPNASVQETENFLYSVEREWQQELPSAFELSYSALCFVLGDQCYRNRILQ